MDRVETTARLRAVVRRRWERLDWSAPLAANQPVMPESHYMSLEGLALSERQRLGLNRLFACFTCELFVHFEGYVIAYLERSPHRVPTLSRALLERFVAEERVHTEMFGRLLHRLRPDLYGEPRDHHVALRFLKWRASDDLVLGLAPVGTFFLLAWLFEEITLFVPAILDAAPAESADLVRQVMALHAREEESHVAIDAHVMTHLTANCPRWWARTQSVLTLPLLGYVDSRVRRAWLRLVTHAADELDLTAAQRDALRERGPSRSDVAGMESFVAKMARAPLPGTRPLCWTLRRVVAAA